MAKKVKKKTDFLDMAILTVAGLALMAFILFIGIPHAMNRVHIWNTYSDLEEKVEVLEKRVTELERKD